MSVVLPAPSLAFDDSDEPLALPAERSAPARPTVPLLATFVPVLGAVVLWVVTGSVLSLWLAALGPLIAGATLLDALRTARRDRRRADAERDAAHARLARIIDERHDLERARRRDQHPDVAGFLTDPAELWRAVPGRADGLVVGSGTVPSALRLSGGGADPESVSLRRRARTLSGAPVVVQASGVVAVTGPPVIAGAVSRALLLQTCLAQAPGEVRIVGPLSAEDAWAEHLPHRAATTGTAVALVGAGAIVPPDADLAIVCCGPAAPVPPGCAAVLTAETPCHARLDVGGDIHDVVIEGVSRAQAEHVALELARRFGAHAPAAPAPPQAVHLRSLLSEAPSHGLAAVIGVENGTAFCVDLVADGPHAVVAGMTGMGKSELLISWVLALCATRSPREVSFLLADFKGGTAFDPLTALPHVTGVITDLDGAGARRAIESLRAEVRWRESALARVGARDIADPRVELPRLVVVVDEFAALLGDHPELHAVFTDIAARGRALGMHLVLGTQRVSGVVRDALLANCPLRISLRVADSVDSRAVVGTDDAARLPGGDEGRGLALVRRAGDGMPRRVRIALTEAADIAGVAATAGTHRPRRPWLPDLPHRVDLADLRDRREPGRTLAEGAPERPDRSEPDLVLGLADEPAHQRQVVVTVAARDRGVLVTGSAGTGKSTALRTLAAQSSSTITVPGDPEAAWDAVAALAETAPPPRSLVMIDDLDALAARFPPDYAAELVERLERIVRGAGDQGLLVVAAAQRLTGATGRLADLFPRRIVLGAPSRAEYIALGGDPAHHAADAPAGRARVDGRAVQIAVTPPGEDEVPREPARWYPSEAVTGFAARRSASTRATVDRWQEAGVSVVRVADGAAVLEDAGRVGAAASGQRTVIVGDAEDWQRHWHVLAAVRDEHALVIDTSLAADVRVLSADRAVPPYCVPGRPRAWLCGEGMPLVRIALPRSPSTAVAP